MVKKYKSLKKARVRSFPSHFLNLHSIVNVRHNYASPSKYSLDGTTVKAATLSSTATSNKSNFLACGILCNLKAFFFSNLKSSFKTRQGGQK